MANKIILKKSAVSGKIPISADLDFGELAINYADGIIYFKDSNGLIQSLTGNVANPTAPSLQKSRQYFFSSF